MARLPTTSVVAVERLGDQMVAPDAMSAATVIGVMILATILGTIAHIV